jgi:hypothetical protein
MALRSGIGITEETDKEKDKQETITRKVRGVDVVTRIPDDKVGGFTSAAAGVGSGIVKTVEGVVSLGAELMDLGLTENAADEVESFFDTINIF